MGLCLMARHPPNHPFMPPLHNHHMARDRQEFAGPDFKPADAQFNAERATQAAWDTFRTCMPAAGLGMVYVDRVGKEMFVGRYDHGTCSTIPKDAAKHADVDMPQQDVYPIHKRQHAYIVTITPQGAESVCLYCGTTMEGCPSSKLRLADIPWDEPWDKPRRANARELEAMNVTPIPIHRQLYLDAVDGDVWAGRMRIGECPHGGPHEVVMHWWRKKKDPKLSACVFCGEQWLGAPPGFWGVLEPDLTTQGVLAQHAEDVRRGLY